MRDKVVEIIKQSADSLNPTFPHSIDLTQGTSAKLYGGDGPLDSLALVRLIVEVESGIEDAFQQSITLASERAMSQKRSPFLTIGHLADYVNEILAEGASNGGDLPE